MGSVIFDGNIANNVKIAYIGGGSRGWARMLMSDLAKAEDMNGSVALYDLDFEAAKCNEIIGNRFNDLEGAKSKFTYTAVHTLAEALTGADFVVISILPGTFEEMASDLNTPEKYGIYQPVGDSTGPGGVIRALRSIPMFQEIARGVRDYCPDAWVINYTNPMTLCTAALYKEFPDIKAFGCCHEVFNTQNVLADAVRPHLPAGTQVTRRDIKTNVVGVNHFTWLTSARYRNIDLYPIYREYIKDCKANRVPVVMDENWMNRAFKNDHSVKFDLFERYGIIAAAGDRHLAEFCEGSWYLNSPKEVIETWHFCLTTAEWRKTHLKELLEKTEKILSGEEELKIVETGEEGVLQMRALLGLEDLVTNVNIPNIGQIPNLPIGAVVETNASFRTDSVTPVMAGNVPTPIYNLISRIVGEQMTVLEAAFNRDLEMAFRAFVNDPLVRLDVATARKLFDEMVENTKEYLTEYFK